ncbi:MAG: T9SS type A sorting domain-containing protein [Flavobacteriales bacterium]|nr:T9SS type A sorting domain-containing protein [Flavobacteriales bacterium]
MKKIYALFAVLSMAFVGNAQENLTLTLDNHTAGAATSDDPLNLDFTITNNGPTIPSGDTIFWAINVGTDFFSSIDLDGPGSVTYSVLGEDFPNGSAFGVDVADISMEWVYNNLGLTGDVCAVVFGVGQATLSSPTDTDPTDNIGCVFYTVTEVAGIEDEANAIGNIYVADQKLKIESALGNFDAETTITITSLSGQIVQNETAYLQGATHELELNDITPGIYVASVTINGEVTTKKIIIE